MPTSGTVASFWINMLLGVLAGGVAGIDPSVFARWPWLVALIPAINAALHAGTGSSAPGKGAPMLGPKS